MFSPSSRRRVLTKNRPPVPSNAPKIKSSSPLNPPQRMKVFTRLAPFKLKKKDLRACVLTLRWAHPSLVQDAPGLVVALHAVCVNVYNPGRAKGLEMYIWDDSVQWVCRFVAFCVFCRGWAGTTCPQNCFVLIVFSFISMFQDQLYQISVIVSFILIFS